MNRRDQYHAWAREQWGRIAPPMLTCESVLSEACFLLGGGPAGGDQVMQLLERKILAVPLALDAQASPVARLLRKYASVPMSLADACLVRMSELCPSGPVFTLDSDFAVYRRNGRQKIPTLRP